jgi:hypothetical protein
LALVLAVGSQLHGHDAGMGRADIHERHADFGVGHVVNEGRGVLGDARPQVFRIEITEPAMQGASASAGVQAGLHQLGQRAHRRGVELHGIIRQASVRRGGITAHALGFPANHGEISLQSLSGKIGILSLQKSQPGIIRNP